jgi:type IV pilus assembly protein PilM
MSKKNDSWGIEVGANALKAIRLVRDGNEVEVAAYDVIPFKKVLTTPDLAVDEAIKVNLDQFLARHDLSKSAVVVSVPGNMAFARFAKLPPVEPKKIGEIVKYEAMQQIPFPIEQVEWDYQVFSQPDSPDVEVGIFAIAKDRAAQFLSNYQQLNIKIEAVTLSPVAALNALGYDLDLFKSGKGTIIIDIGTTSTDLIVCEGGRVWLRTMAIGGNNFTEALVKAFKLSFPKAEKLKREAGTSKYARQIFQAMRPVFADLVQEIQKSLGFYQSSNRDAELHQLIGVGSTFRLPGLQKFLKQQLQIEVIRPDGFKKIKVDGKQAADFSENALNMATAYGCALQGLGMEQVSANILPEHVLKARVWKAKQPWIAAAAAIVAVAVGGAWVRLSMERSAYEAAREESNRTAQPIIAQANELKDKLQRDTADPRMRIENLQRVLDYRDVWPKLMEDVGLAAASLGAQEVLGEPSYDEHKKIDRNKRRRVFIESYSAQYVDPRSQLDPAAAGAIPPGGPGAFKPLNRDQAFGPSGVAAPPAMAPQPGPGTPPGPTTPGQPGAAPVPASTRPSIIITIEGTTPYSSNNTSVFLDDNIIRYLKVRLAERKDRPYRVVKDSVALVSVTPIKDDDKDGTKGQSTTPRPRGLIRPSTRPSPEEITPRGTPRRGGTAAPPRPELPGPGALPDPAVKEEFTLFPVRPLADEKQTGDSRFVIKWTVEMLSPEEIRLLEDAAKNAATPKPSASTDGAPAAKLAAERRD